MIQQYDTYEQYKVKRKIMITPSALSNNLRREECFNRFTLPQNEPDTMQQFDIFLKYLIYNSEIQK